MITIIFNNIYHVLTLKSYHLSIENVSYRLFRQHPEYQSIFKKLKGLTIDELPTNPQFIRHASKVGGALGSAIDHLDKPEELEELLTNLGIKHKKYGLKPEHFNVS